MGSAAMPYRMKPMAILLYLVPALPLPWWWNLIVLGVSTLGASVAGLHEAYRVLLLFMIADFLTGMAAAAFSPLRQGLSARAFGLGVCKKATYLVLCAMCSKLQGPLHLPFDPGIAAAYFFCAVDGLSTVENADEIGVKVPPWLRPYLTKLRDQAGNPRKGGLL